MIANLTSFTNEGMKLKLDFSDPILVSQGEADAVIIRLLKSYFLQIDETARRLWTVFSDDEEFLILRKEIPK